MKRCKALNKNSVGRCRKRATSDLCTVHARLKRQGRELEIIGKDWEPRRLKSLEERLEAVREKLDPGPPNLRKLGV